MHCRIESADCPGPCRRIPTPATGETIGILLWQEDHQERRPQTGACAFGCMPQPFLQPSASRAAWRIRAPHHLSFTDGAMSVPCFPRTRCETGPGPSLGTVRHARALAAEISPPARIKIISLGSGSRARRPLAQAVHVIMTKIQARSFRSPLGLPARTALFQ